MTGPTTPASTRQPGRPPTRDSKPLSERITEAVAETADTSHDELDPLYEVIDPDALDHLFAPTAAGDTRADGQIMFMYNGFHVTVASNGTVDIDPLNEAKE